jgi:hypothetical protein
VCLIAGFLDLSKWPVVIWIQLLSFLSTSTGISSQRNLRTPALLRPVCFELPSSYSNLIISFAEMNSNKDFLHLLGQFFTTFNNFTFSSYFTINNCRIQRLYQLHHSPSWCYKLWCIIILSYLRHRFQTPMYPLWNTNLALFILCHSNMHVRSPRLHSSGHCGIFTM